MLRKIVSAGAAIASVAGLALATAPTANAYVYWRNGWLYADTSYSGNVSGAYVKIAGKPDPGNGVYYVYGWVCDQRTDSNTAAARIMGYDVDSRQWTSTLKFTGGSSKGCSSFSGRMGISSVDRIILQDGIYDRYYGTNSVMIYRRK
jgi:hypothetical protein